MLAYTLYIHTIGNTAWEEPDIILDTERGINYGISACSFEIRVNDAGNLQFTMLKSHPYVDFLELMNLTVALRMRYIDDNGTVRDDWWPFLGRVISITRDIYGNKTVSCEGAMNFLNDTYMTYWDHKYNTMAQFISSGIDSYNKIKRRYPAGSNDFGEKWRQISYSANAGQGSSNAFTFTKEYDKENKNTTYLKVMDGIKDKIFGAYGGILYFVYSPKSNTPGNNLLGYNIQCAYYDEVVAGFSYEGGGTFPSDSSGVAEYGGPTPCFGIADNITNITEQPVKTGLWTAIMPVGEDGITKMGDPHDLNCYDVMYLNEFVSNSGAYSDEIVKAVEFSEVKKGANSGTDLVNKGRQYIRRFGISNFFTAKNYTIDGVEPCLVFEDVNRIIKLAHRVVIQPEHIPTYVTYPCISIKHDVFDPSNSEYEIGPIIPDNIINEDISTWK